MSGSPSLHSRLQCPPATKMEKTGSMEKLPTTERTRLYANPDGVFLHNAILAACREHASRTAIVDTSVDPFLRLSYAEYGERVERVAKGLVGGGIRPQPGPLL